MSHSMLRWTFPRQIAKVDHSVKVIFISRTGIESEIYANDYKPIKLDK